MILRKSIVEEMFLGIVGVIAIQTVALWELFLVTVTLIYQTSIPFTLFSLEEEMNVMVMPVIRTLAAIN